MIQNTFKPMRIGIDGRALQASTSGGNVGGITRYTIELCQILDRELPNAEFFVYTTKNLEFQLPSNRWIIRQSNDVSSKFIKAPIWLRYFAQLLIKKDNINIFWGAATLLPKIQNNKDVKLITTVYDFCHLYAPETMSFQNKVSHYLFFKKSIKEADCISTISNGTAKKLKSHFGVKNVNVTKPSVRQSLLEIVNNDVGTIKEKYLLSVGTLEPRKNISSLLKAFTILKKDLEFNDLQLYVAGAQGWKSSVLYQELLETKDVKLLGFASDQELVRLYKSAYAFIFPSLYEGFGMPVMEASACGATVIASDMEEIREAGNANTIYIRPTPEEIVKAVKSIGSRAHHGRISNSNNEFAVQDFINLFKLT
jgi:glycosyltransferase involved in cell wall biosynthesis